MEALKGERAKQKPNEQLPCNWGQTENAPLKRQFLVDNNIIGLPFLHFCLKLLNSGSFADHDYRLGSPFPTHLLHFHIHPQNPPDYRFLSADLEHNGDGDVQ